MNDISDNQLNKPLAELAIDPDVLAKELAAEIQVDPLDDIDFDGSFNKQTNSNVECDEGLLWLQSGHEERLQGLRIFCEYRDPRCIQFLIPLLQEPCPVERMSAVYALGRNPCPKAVDLLLQILKQDSNAYVRRATAWSLGNYPDSPVLEPLIETLKKDVAAVRLWATSSLAEVGLSSEIKAHRASQELLESLNVDTEPGVRSNCIWSLDRLLERLDESLQLKVPEAFLNVLLQDSESSVRYEARIALEQIKNPLIQNRYKNLILEGLLI